ncbi:Eukaryotic-type DNA primaselarge subunit family protein [Aphelenchoides avenae]|nr:Eukaryotic-type DNA primaselarge subunit family protein [Aphelenchus avenae]
MVGTPGRAPYNTPKQESRQETSWDPNGHNLNLYTDPPAETISLLEFQEFGRKRLSVLRKIEDLTERYSKNKEKLQDCWNEIKKIMVLPSSGMLASDVAQARRLDRISHFVLRLAFCQSVDQSNWFIQQELELFKLRCAIEGAANVEDFLKMNGIELHNVDKREQAGRLRDSLINGSGLIINPEKEFDVNFYKVDFTEVLDLVRGRRCYLEQGYCYITASDLVVFVGSKFRANLSAAIARDRVQFGFIQENDRLVPLMKQMVNGSSGPRNYTAKHSEKDIAPAMVDDLAKASFPLCMRSVHIHLRAEHHLRHFARRQYGLFLKGIGMSLESQIEFFRAEFTKKLDSDKFNKEYVYNIRHMYGKEGGRVEGGSMSCPSIINRNPPAAQDCHGKCFRCPYRHLDDDALSQRLQRCGLNRDQVNKIRDLSKAHQYDKACARFFEITHKMPEGGLGAVITHPNQYFEWSRDILEGKRSRDGGATQVVVLNTQRTGTQATTQMTTTPMEDDDFHDDSQFMDESQME